MADVFISYAREDRTRAEAVARAIQARGWTVWWDPKLRHGQSYARVIDDELRAARCVVVLWSQHSAWSEWVHAEAADGASRGILVPAKLEDVRLPLEFSRKHTADLTAWAPTDSSPELEDFLTSIESMLGGRAGPPPESPSPPVQAPRPRLPWFVIVGVVAVAMLIVLGIIKPWSRKDVATTTNADPPPATTTTTATTSTATTTTQSQTQSAFIVYGEPYLRADRSVRARLEIDVMEGLPRPALEVTTTRGTVTVAEVLRANGIDVTVEWGTFAASESGPDRKLDDGELRAVMRRHRRPDEEGEWHFYVIIGTRYTEGSVYSILFDDMRRAAAVFVEQIEDPREVTHSIIHEIGHELNLPHPFNAYGDTRSAMTYPFRWTDWNYDDPTTYQFDLIGQMHIRRGPEKYVRPGASRFFDYGAPQNQWEISGPM